MASKYHPEDYVAVLNALQPPIKQRRPRGPKVRLFESGIPPEGSDLFVPILEALSQLSVSEPKQRVAMAYAMRMQRPEDDFDDEELARTGKRYVFHSTLFVSQTSASGPSEVMSRDKAKKTELFLTDLWECMKEISACLVERQPITQLAHRPTWPKGATGEKTYLRLRDKIRDLQRRVFSHGFLKIRRRILKRWDLFDAFVDHVRKDESIGLIVKSTLVKIRNAMVSPVSTFRSVKDPKPSKKTRPKEKEKPILPLAVMNDLNDSLVFCERIYRRQPIPDSAVDSLNEALQKFLPRYRKKHPNAKFDDSTALDVKRYAETVFAHSETCRVLENIAYSWRYVPLFRGHMSAVVIPEDIRELRNLPLSEEESRHLLQKALRDKKVNFEAYVLNMKKNGYFAKTSGRKSRVHHECNLVAYIHRRFRIDDTIRRFQTRDPSYEPSPYPFIGVSKPSCLLCKAYIDAYNSLMWPAHPGGVFRSYARSSPLPIPAEVLSDSIDGIWLCPQLEEKKMDEAIEETLIAIISESIANVEIDESVTDDSTEETSKWRNRQYLSVDGINSRPVSVAVSTDYSNYSARTDDADLDAKRRVSTSAASFRDKVKGFMGIGRRSSASH